MYLSADRQAEAERRKYKKLTLFFVALWLCAGIKYIRILIGQIQRTY